MKHLFKALSMLIFIIAILMTTSCMKSQDSKFKNEVITAGNISDIVQKIKDENTLGKEDVELLTTGMIRLSATKDSLIGKKVSQVIQSQREYLYNSSMSGLLTSANQIEMNLDLSVTFTQKLKAENDSVNADGIEFILKNNTDKDITSITGEIRLISGQNQLLGVRPVNYDNVLLKAGTEAKQQEVWPHDVNNPAHKALRDEKNLVPIWVPQTITFAGGKKLTTQTQQQPQQIPPLQQK